MEWVDVLEAKSAIRWGSPACFKSMHGGDVVSLHQLLHGWVARGKEGQSWALRLNLGSFSRCWTVAVLKSTFIYRELR